MRVAAQEIISNPGYCAQFYPTPNVRTRERTFPISVPINGEMNFGIRMSFQFLSRKREKRLIQQATAAYRNLAGLE